MGTVALTLSIVGLFTWVFPVFGFPVSIVGLILGLIVLIKKSPNRRKAIAAVILCFIEIVLNIGIVVGLVTAGVILDEFLKQYPGY